MGPADELEVVVGEELRGDLGSKQPAGTAGRHRPALHLLGVGPHQVTEGALVRDLLVPLDESDLVQSPDVGREAAVDAEDMAVDERGDGEHVEHLAAVAPHVAVPVLVLTLVVEPVNLHTSKYLFTNISAFKYF